MRLSVKQVHVINFMPNLKRISFYDDKLWQTLAGGGGGGGGGGASVDLDFLSDT